MTATWSEWLVAALLPASGVLVLVAALGLWRLPDLFQRLHAPALASTLGSWLVALASVIHFSAREGLALQAWLVIVVLSITAPVTTVVLARAAMFRGRRDGAALPASPAGATPPAESVAPSRGRP